CATPSVREADGPWDGAASSRIGDDGNLPVGLQDRILDLLHALQAGALARRLQDVVLLQARLGQPFPQQAAVIQPQRRRAVEPAPYPRTAQLDDRPPHIRGDQRANGQDGGGQRIVVTQQRLLGGFDDHQQQDQVEGGDLDRKSTRLNSSHVKISYAVFC